MSNTELIRWIKRCRDGDEIPSSAIVEHKLNRWFAFTVLDGKQVALAEATGEKVDFATGEMIADPDYTKPPSEAAKSTKHIWDDKREICIRCGRSRHQIIDFTLECKIAAGWPDKKQDPDAETS